MKNTTERHLKRLKVKNFQSHKLTELEFSPGINIITGLEDSGKTALLRAVNWLRINRPSGDSFKHNKDPNAETEVELEFADGVKIVHTKGKSSSSYQSYNPAADSTTAVAMGFTKVGKDVPGPITELLQLEEINIQEQFDQPYLVWLTSGELANVFNRMSGMQCFDEWQSAVSAGVRAATAGIKASSAEADYLQQQLARYTELPAAEKLVDEIAATDKEITAAGLQFNRLRQLELSISSSVAAINRLDFDESEIELAINLCSVIRDADDSVLLLKSKATSLEDLLEKFTAVKDCEQAFEKVKTEYTSTLRAVGICDRCYGNIDAAAIQRIEESFNND